MNYPQPGIKISFKNGGQNCMRHISARSPFGKLRLLSNSITKTEMTKFLLLLSISCAFLSIGALVAQPVLNFSSLPPLGTVLKSSEVNGTGISPGPAGANQSWNFSSFPDTGVVENIQFANPASTPYAAMFPSSNGVSVGVANYQGTVVTTYSYTNASASGLDLTGSVISYGPSFEITTKLPNPQTIYSFPAGFNSVSNDEFVTTQSVMVIPPGPPSTNVIPGTASYVIDGYGTLVTSSGTYPNSLRFKRREITNDTTRTIVGEGQTFVTYRQTRKTAYEWVTVQASGSHPVWLISYDTTQVKQGVISPPQEITSLAVNHTYRDISSSADNKIQNESFKLSLFPNPANNQVMLRLQEDARVRLLDIRGKEIKTEYFSLNQPGLPILDLSTIQSGTYIVKVDGNNFSSFARLIVSH
jgi:hypothetical protein